MEKSSDHSKPAYAGRCPICGNPAEHASRPFCSRRCADIDLARWLGGKYAISGGSGDADEDGDDRAADETPPGPAKGDDDSDD